ncbi:PQQ-dependent sugar dehydrogenase [Intrasporangium sp.]|uniref:PQQ-dependent sugar dehydrogenase n=1 Tax=Intrasporangium sp. TaxID=1925024 RepID=UPI0033656DC8
MMAHTSDGIARSRIRAGRVAALMVAGLIATTALVASVGSHEATAAQRLPSGFILQDISTGMTPPSAAGPGDLLTDFDYLPDESFFAVGKYGLVQWVPKSGTPRRIASLSVVTTGDLGLVSVAVAPDYESSRTIYTARALPSTGPGSGETGILRLSKWTVVVDRDGLPTGLSDERALLETSSDGWMHTFGSVLVEPDATIWVSIGDGVINVTDKMALRSLDVNDVHGKVLRLRPDGSGHPDNPFYDPANPRAARSLVFASGLRSPFRFSLDPGTGLPVLGDVGRSVTEEVDLIRPGYSFGWPCWEASLPAPGYKDLPECVGVTTAKPLWEYPHAGSGAAVTGGIVYTGTSYPAAYRGRYFFADYVDHTLWTLGFSPAGELTAAPEPDGFGVDVGAPVRFAAGPGGDIVFADISAARLRRLVYAPGNAAPVPSFTSTANADTRTMSFDAQASFDPNGDTLTYRWDFGDGTAATGVTATHRYAADPDHYTVTLTVTDPLGLSAQSARVVYPANHSPTLNVNWPDSAVTYAVGEVIHASATASDPEDGRLSVSWSSRLEHCYTLTDCHQHYGVTGQGPTFDLPMEGHEGDTQLWLTASASDSHGATTTSDFAVQPRQHRVTVSSTWPAAFTIGDTQTTSTLLTEGMTVSVVAADKGFDGLSTFVSWADGPTSRSRPITIGPADLTLSAVYRTPIDDRYESDAAFRTKMGEPTGAEQGDLALRSKAFAGGVAHWSPTAGVHFVTGAIGKLYAALGGPGWCSVPTTDELPTNPVGGYYNHFTRGCSIFWSSATGAHSVNGVIRDLWASLGWERSLLGYPTTNLAPTAARPGYQTRFQRGAIYYSGSTGAQYLTGPISAKYLGIGAEGSPLQFPTTPTRNTPSGGQYQHFQGGSIYWSSSTGAHRLGGSIRSLYASLGWERSWLGYPVTDIMLTPSKNGYLTRFQGGTIYWSGATGSRYLGGPILTKYVSMGAEASVLRYPTTHTANTASGLGRYQHFQGGSLFWSSATGAHPVTGAIRSTWAKLGYERSWLGYPKSDPYAVSGGVRQNFQHGYLVWSRSTGAVKAYRT